MDRDMHTANSQVDENHQASNTEQEVEEAVEMEDVQCISPVKYGIRKFSSSGEKMDANENHFHTRDVSSRMTSPSKQKTSQPAQEQKSPQECVGINKRKDHTIAIQTNDYQSKKGEWL